MKKLLLTAMISQKKNILLLHSSNDLYGASKIFLQLIDTFLSQDFNIHVVLPNKGKLDDFLNQIQQVKKMGNVKDLMGMIPGAGKAMKNIDIDDDAFKGVEAIIKSMTPKERREPKIIDSSRKKRIAKGSGKNIQEVNQLMKQFNQMSKMMKMMQGGKGKNMLNMMQNFGK